MQIAKTKFPLPERKRVNKISTQKFYRREKKLMEFTQNFFYE